MAQDTTLHVKVEPDLAAHLRELARKKGTSVGSLVRRAIVVTYQPEMLDLSPPRRQAVEAYCGGFISIGRLAEAMGMHVLRLRSWLRDHDIQETTRFGIADLENA